MHRIALKLKNLMQNSPDVFFGEKLKKCNSATLNAVVSDFLCLRHMWKTILSLVLSIYYYGLSFWVKCIQLMHIFSVKSAVFTPFFSINLPV